MHFVEKHPIVTGFGVLLLIIGLSVGGWLLKAAFAPTAGKVNQRIVTNEVGNRIAQYDKFFDDCASIEGLENQIKNTQAQLKTTTDTDRKNFLSSVLLGYQNNRAEAIALYNANARKAGTNGQFRASDLPYTLHVNGVTQCSLD